MESRILAVVALIGILAPGRSSPAAEQRRDGGPTQVQKVDPTVRTDARRALNDLTQHEEVQKFKGKRVILADFNLKGLTDAQKQQAEAFHKSFDTGLSPFFKPVERAELDRIVGELKLSLSVLADPEHADKLRQIKIADCLIAGTASVEAGRVTMHIRLVEISTTDRIHAIERRLGEVWEVLLISRDRGGVHSGMFTNLQVNVNQAREVPVDLARYDAVCLVYPEKELTRLELLRLEQYVANGGGLAVAGLVLDQLAGGRGRLKQSVMGIDAIARCELPAEVKLETPRARADASAGHVTIDSLTGGRKVAAIVPQPGRCEVMGKVAAAPGREYWFAYGKQSGKGRFYYQAVMGVKYPELNQAFASGIEWLLQGQSLARN
jgi:hypothetical protein